MTNKPEITPELQAHHDVLKNVKGPKAWLTYFEPALNNWQPTWGKRPSNQMLWAAYALAAKRHGSAGVETYGCALFLRDQGCEKGKPSQYTNSATASNLRGDGVAVGTMRNKLDQIVGSGWAREVNVGGKFVRLEITKAGEAHIARYLGVADDKATAAQQSAKAAAKVAKPRKAPTAAAGKPEPAPATPLPADAENAPVSPAEAPEAIAELGVANEA